MVTNAAKFRLGQEFESAAFNTREYRSSWQPPTALFEAAGRPAARSRLAATARPSAGDPRGP